MAAFAADAAEDAPRASMMAAPRFATVGRNVPSTHAWSFTASYAFFPPTSQWKRSGYWVVEWLPQMVILRTSATVAPSFCAICVMARLWSRRVIAVNRPGSRPGAFCWAINELVFAGLPTTRIFTSFFADSDNALPWGLKIPPLAVEQVGALHAGLARHRTHEQRDIHVTERNVRVVGHHDAGEEREGTVVELHLHALERLQRRRDLEQLQDDLRVGTEHRAGRDAEQE